MERDPPETSGYMDVVTGSSEPQPRLGAAYVSPVSAPELKTLVSLAMGAIVVAALYFGRDVLIPITLAVMLSFALSPVVGVLQRLGLSRAPSVIFTVFAALGLLGAVGTLIGSQAAALAENAPAYAQTLQRKVQGVQVSAIARVASITEKFQPHRPPPSTRGTQAGGGSTRAPIPVRVVGEESSPFAIAQALLTPVIGPLETTVIVLVVAVFILMQREDLRDRFIRLFGTNDLHRTTRAMDDAGERVSRYFLAQLAVNTCFGFAVTLGLWLIGVPSPAMWGVMAGILRFVPYVGSFLAAVAPAALAAAVDPAWTMAIEVAALFLVLEPITGYVVEPLLYGRSTGLSPVSVIISAIFWTWLWGPIGLIMSTPLTLILVVMGRHVKSLEFLDVLLGDRPALTPVESFYQRILANNPDEALAEAEALLAAKPMVDYCDEVVLPALKLASEDHARGTIEPDRQDQINQAIAAVVTEIAENAAAPGEEETGPPVVCVAGPGPFDQAIATMAAQLLRTEHVAAWELGHSETSREAVRSLDLRGSEVIFIANQELTGSPAALRYLIKRLRARAPGARVIAGMWQQGEAALSDPATRDSTGADRCVGSLNEAIAAVLEQLRTSEAADSAHALAEVRAD